MPAVGVRGGNIQEPLGAQIMLVPAMADPRETTSGRTLDLENLVGPGVHAPLGGHGRDDLHRAGDNRSVQLAERQNPSREGAHGCRPSGRDGSRDERRRRQWPVIDRGNHAGAHQLRLGLCRGLITPQAQKHRRKRLAADGLIEGDTAHEDPAVGRHRDRR